MALRATKPVLEPNRFRALVYGNKGAGKTHFVLSMPNVYYIDTEGASKYKQFVEMLNKNNSMIVVLHDLQEIISEVKELLTTKHNYKTLVIDSISMPCGHLAILEAERLMKKSPGTEGTEFGANLAKVKRLTFQLGILLSRLDMNVIVTAHEKTKYEKNVEIGKDADVNEKLGYALGSQFNLRLQGKSRKLFVEKTRYKEFETNSLIDFDDGYAVLKEKFGEDIFAREATPEVLSSKEQVIEIKRLIDVLKYPEEKVQKWFAASQANSFEEMKAENIQKCINLLNSTIKGD